MTPREMLSNSDWETKQVLMEINALQHRLKVLANQKVEAEAVILAGFENWPEVDQPIMNEGKPDIFATEWVSFMKPLLAMTEKYELSEADKSMVRDFHDHIRYVHNVSKEGRTLDLMILTKLVKRYVK